MTHKNNLITPLNAISPLDGRYATKLSALNSYVSEYALIKYRYIAEIKWFICLAKSSFISALSCLPDETFDYLENLIHQFDEKDAQQIKEIEQTTNHDVKAVEYYIQQQFKTHSALNMCLSFIHFGCTSEDINNIAYALMLKECRTHILLPYTTQLIETLTILANQYADTAMLSRTHGQSASPTTIGKEWLNTAVRLSRAQSQFKNVIIYAKCNGAVGNFNAHCIAYPDIDWPLLSANFIESLDLHVNQYTTQIEPHDYIAEYAHALARMHTILIDFARDTWGYISLDYLGQRAVSTETGSSTMPHKINPILFENAEGNLGIANALLHFFAEKLPISRWQRDLSDSTVLRNIGVAIGHSCLSYDALLAGLKKITVNKQMLFNTLTAHPEILAEAIQTVMRRYGIFDAYEQLKAHTRGKEITLDALHAFIHTLTIPEEAKQRLKALKPTDYTGCAEQLVTQSNIKDIS